MSFILLGILNSQETAAAAGAFDLLETTLISSNTASVTFSSLGSYSAYKHLQIRVTVRSSESGSTTGAWAMRFNGSSESSSYAAHWLLGNGTNVTSSRYVNNTMMDFQQITGAAAVANSYAAAIFDILDFSSTSKNKTVRGLTGMHTTGEPRIYLLSGFRNNTDAITSITIFDQYSNFVSGSRFSLYGIK